MSDGSAHYPSPDALLLAWGCGIGAIHAVDDEQGDRPWERVRRVRWAAAAEMGAALRRMCYRVRFLPSPGEEEGSEVVDLYWRPSPVYAIRAGLATQRRPGPRRHRTA